MGLLLPRNSGSLDPAHAGQSDCCSSQRRVRPLASNIADCRAGLLEACGMAALHGQSLSALGPEIGEEEEVLLPLRATALVSSQCGYAGRHGRARA
jgi:hypothetical protein